MENHNSTRRAEFSERTLAFAVDVALFAVAWALTLKAVSPDVDLGLNPKGAVAGLLWMGIFLIYQAYFSSEGRVSAGKKLLGLKVVSVDGEPLDLGGGVLRALGYLASQLFTAGFLWALFDGEGRALHDYPAGSRVVARGELPPLRRLVSNLAAAALIVAFAGAWGWQNIWAPRYERIMTVAYAQHGLGEFVKLQADYKRAHGRYAENIFALASESVDPQGFLRGATALYDQGHVAFQVDRNHYSIAARANDVDKTLVAVSGP